MLDGRLAQRFQFSQATDVMAARWIKEARVALTVPGAVMMVPGLSALETLVYFRSRRDTLKVSRQVC